MVRLFLLVLACIAPFSVAELSEWKTIPRIDSVTIESKLPFGTFLHQTVHIQNHRKSTDTKPSKAILVSDTKIEAKVLFLSLMDGSIQETYEFLSYVQEVFGPRPYRKNWGNQIRGVSLKLTIRNGELVSIEGLDELAKRMKNNSGSVFLSRNALLELTRMNWPYSWSGRKLGINKTLSLEKGFFGISAPAAFQMKHWVVKDSQERILFFMNTPVIEKTIEVQKGVNAHYRLHPSRGEYLFDPRSGLMTQGRLEVEGEVTVNGQKSTQVSTEETMND